MTAAIRDALNPQTTVRLLFGQQKPRIVILGNGLGGVSAARTLNQLLQKKPDTASVTLVGREDRFVFKPMLPDALNSHAPLIPMGDTFSKKPRVDFKQAEVSAISIDPAQKRVTTSQGQLPYDYLVLALGSQTNYFNIPGAKEHALKLETPQDLEAIKNSVERKLALAAAAPAGSAEQARNLSFVIVGAGATGVELAFELNHYMQKRLPEMAPNLSAKPRIQLVEATGEILPGFSDKERAFVKKAFARQGIEILFHTLVKQVTPNQGLVAVNQKIDPAQILTLDTVDPVWVTGVRAHDLAQSLPVDRTPKGQIKVNPFLEIPGRSDIYVIGDLAAATNAKTGQLHPPTGQVAEQQGAFVGQDLFRKLNDKKGVQAFEADPKRETFHFKNKGMMLSAGPDNGFVNMFSRLLLKGKVASHLRQQVYRQKLTKG